MNKPNEQTQPERSLLSRLAGAVFHHDGNPPTPHVMDLPCTFLGRDGFGATGDHSPELEPNRGPAPSMNYQFFDVRSAAPAGDPPQPSGNGPAPSMTYTPY